MSRAMYCDDLEANRLNLWRGAVERAAQGKRGQKFFQDLVASLDALPEKKLIEGELEDDEGMVCALGAVGKYRGVDMANLDFDHPEKVAKAFNIAEALAREVAFLNDDTYFYSGPGAKPEEAQRWAYMRRWAKDNMK